MCVHISVYTHIEKDLEECLSIYSPLVNTLVYLGCGNVLFLFYLFSLLPIISLNLICDFGSVHVILELPVDATENIKNNNCQEFLNLINSKT